MEIMLLRHGMPRVRRGIWVNGVELAAWVAEYNAAGIDASLPPPEQAIEQANRCAFAVCSDLPRSRESARALGIAEVGACDAMFREMELPYARWRFPRLALAMWVAIFRVMWLCGYAANAEPLGAARRRAGLCAERLMELAAEHGRVVFVGHGTLNWFIARRLGKAGWSGPKKSPRKYWEFSIYRYATERHGA